MHDLKEGLVLLESPAGGNLLWSGLCSLEVILCNIKPERLCLCKPGAVEREGEMRQIIISTECSSCPISADIPFAPVLQCVVRVTHHFLSFYD